MNSRGHARNNVGEIVVTVRRMIDGVTTAARGAPLQRTKLRDKARMIEKLDLAAVNQRQEIAIEIALRTRRKPRS